MALAAHLLDQDGDLHFTTARHGEDLRVTGLCDAQGDIGARLLHEAVPDVAGGDEFAVLSGERAVVDREFHLNGRRVNRDVGQRRACFAVANRLADEHVLEAGQAHNVAGVRLLHLDALHALEVVDGGDLALGDAAVAVAADGGVADLHLALDDFAERDTAEVIGVIQVGHKHLEAVASLRARGRDMLHDGVEERLHGAGDVLQLGLGVTGLGGTIYEREVELLVRRVE